MKKLSAFGAAFFTTLAVVLLPVMGIDDPLITGAEEQTGAADDATPRYRMPQCLCRVHLVGRSGPRHGGYPAEGEAGRCRYR